MTIHAWMEMGMRMNIMMRDVGIHHTSVVVTGIGVLMISGSHEQRICS